MTGRNLNSHTAVTFSAVKSKSEVILTLFFFFMTLLPRFQDIRFSQHNNDTISQTLL